VGSKCRFLIGEAAMDEGRGFYSRHWHCCWGVSVLSFIKKKGGKNYREGCTVRQYPVASLLQRTCGMLFVVEHYHCPLHR